MIVPALRWSGILGGYLASQGTIQTINLVTGFLILRLLSVEQYAVYVIAMMLVTVASVASDMGVSQGVMSIGAPVRDHPQKITSLVQAAFRIRRLLYTIVCPIVVVLTILLFRGHDEYWLMLGTLVALILTLAWGQQTVSILSSVANVHHDARSLGLANGFTAIARLVLVSTICTAIPLAGTAIAINLCGTLLCAAIFKTRIGVSGSAWSVVEASYVERLKHFSLPLVPGIIYYLLQGNIATALLWMLGSTTSVAEVGALGRLGQIIGLITLLNGFFLLPYFARVSSRPLFLRRLAQVLLVLSGICAGLTISTFLVPDWWLLLLGPSYFNLNSELRIAILGAQLSLLGSVIYTICIARGRTRGQWWQIVFGLGAQTLFLAVNGINTTFDALIFNMLPAGTYVLVQATLLRAAVREWK
jgi:O-antigen/teichoic acid export membrane protein